ncbi:MAG: ABC transporter permease [Ekhidna sp.]
MRSPKDLQPPKLADRFFSGYCKNELAESIMGDLHERYEMYRESHSKIISDFKYWMDIIRFINQYTLKNKTTKRTFIPMLMFKNYTLVALRNIRRNKAFTAINVVGLAISMAVCLLILATIDDQNSYDEFHSQRNAIYRITHERLNSEINLAIATTPMPLADKLKNEYAGIEQLVQFARGFGGEVVENGKTLAISGYFTTPTFFELFDFKLAKGDPKTALSNPNSVVLRNDIAEKFFKDQDPIGQDLAIEGLGQFKVTGVLEEIPGKTHITFESLASFSTRAALEKQKILSESLPDWEKLSTGWLYFKFKDRVNLKELQNALNRIADENYNEDSEYEVRFGVQKMTDITPGPLMGNQIGQSMPKFFIYGLVVLAILIMTCAAFNYANLTTARSLTRFKEIGVRKVMGSTKKQIVMQFIIEAVLISLFSLLLAIGLLKLLIPAFESLNMSSMLNWELNPDTMVYLQFLVFSLVTGLVTGFFPSLYMSAVKPINALKGMKGPKMSKIGLRKFLIVSQLVISVVLIISATLVHRQIKYMATRDYGFRKENIVNISLQGQAFDLLKPELEKLAFVDLVSGANNIPSTGTHDDIEVRKSITDESDKYNYFSVDERYIDNLKLELLAGTNFTPDQQEEKEVIINEQAVEALGFADNEEAIGSNIILSDSTHVNIVGVVKNYNYMILYMEIRPMLLRYNPEEFTYAQVKVAGLNSIEELKALESTWSEFDPNHDFEYKYFDEQIEEFYSMFYDIVYIVGLISILSIVIAGMGLLGIATYTIQTRLKEVGIRKILGANGKNLMIILGRSFFIMIIISTAIGGLISFFGNRAWLELFAYRISLGYDIIVIAFLFILVIGGLTIGTQTWKAMRTNPADILRDE